MEKKNSCARAGFSTILWGILAVLLCAPAYGAVLTVHSEDTLNVGTGKQMEEILSSEWWWVDVYGTLNMYPGAYIEPVVYAYAGSTVNIYGGEFGDGWLTVMSTDAAVTIYGTGFTLTNAVGVKLDNTENPQWIQITNPVQGGSGTLTWEYQGLTYTVPFSSSADISLAAPAIAVDIDIKPGSYPNSINLGSNGVIPVAILSTADFDATTVLPETVSLAGSGVAVRGKGNKLLAHEEDVNGDGLTDLVVKVETENLDPGTFQDGLATLTGQTSDGVQFEGSDEIIIVPAAE